MKIKVLGLPAVTILMGVATCSVPSGAEARAPTHGLGSAGHRIQRGVASWYQSGRRTANGEAFRPGGMTAAHRSLPFGTRVRVVHERSGRSVVVRINDRGPFSRGRVIDLARGPARALGLTGSGVATVAVYRL